VLQKSFYIIAISALLCSQCTNNAPTNPPEIKQTPTTRIPTPSPVFTLPIPAVVPTQTNTPIPTDTQIVPPTYLPTEPPLAPLTPGQIINLSDLHMTDKTNGWAIEFNGHIVHSTDGGYTWQDVTPPVEVNQSFSESGFFALDAQTAWATPGEFVNCYIRKGGKASINNARVWRTNNGGQDWQVSQPIPVSLDPTSAALPIQNYFPIRMQFLDPQTGWLMIDGGIRTEDNKLKTLGAILLHTTDGGQHWVVINDHYHDFKFPSGETPETPAIPGFVFIDTQTGWTVGQNYYAGIEYVPVENVLSHGALSLKRTGDGGHSFVDIPLWFPADLSQPEYKGLTIGCGVGEILRIAPDSLALKWSCTINANPHTSYYLFTMLNKDGQPLVHLYSTENEFFLNEKEGWRQPCAYAGTLCPLEYTSDGGVNWTTIKKVNWGAWQLDFVDSKSGWAIVFANDSSGTKALVRTSNGGETWVEIKPKVANQ
jgi:photosystem II stability/assembly factor-like uncharacterized protein